MAVQEGPPDEGGTPNINPGEEDQEWGLGDLYTGFEGSLPELGEGLSWIPRNPQGTYVVARADLAAQAEEWEPQIAWEGQALVPEELGGQTPANLEDPQEAPVSPARWSELE